MSYLRAIPTRVVVQPARCSLIGAAALSGQADMIRARRARIVATLGPARPRRPDKAASACAKAGVDVFRLNFSHGEHADHAAALERCAPPRRSSSGRLRRWPTCRARSFAWASSRARKASIEPGHALPPRPRSGARTTSTQVCLPHPELFAALSPGAELLLDDGKVRLKVSDSTATSADTVVIKGTALSEPQGHRACPAR